MKFSNYHFTRASVRQIVSQLMQSRTIIIMVLSSFFIITIAYIILIHYPSPPLSSIELSRKAYSNARHAFAENYAPVKYKEVESLWQRTLTNWSRENQKIFFKRDFKTVQDLAKKTFLLAQQSEQIARQTQDSLKSVAQIMSALISNKMTEFKLKYNQMPLTKFTRAKFTKGELLFYEGEAAFKRGDFRKAVALIKLANANISETREEVAIKINNYLRHIPLWQGWMNQLINWSKNNNETAIIIDKIDHGCLIYNNGELIKNYTIELGPNWIGHKQQKGDNATPEGQYAIVKKIFNGNSKYYKALVINYPNEIDQEKFNNAKKAGELPANAHIGGLIEIHGDGGKGIDWTQGCIAMKNGDLDDIFNMVKIGTPVTIVGTTRKMKSYATLLQASN